MSAKKSGNDVIQKDSQLQNDTSSNSVRRSSRICLRRSFGQATKLNFSPSKCDAVDDKSEADKPESDTKQSDKKPSEKESLVEEKDSELSFSDEKKQIQNSNLKTQIDSEIVYNKIKDSISEVEISQTVISNKEIENSREDQTFKKIVFPLRSNEPEESQDISKEGKVNNDLGSEINLIDEITKNSDNIDNNDDEPYDSNKERVLSILGPNESEENQDISKDGEIDNDSRSEINLIDEDMESLDNDNDDKLHDSDRETVLSVLGFNEPDESQDGSKEQEIDNESESEINIIDEVIEHSDNDDDDKQYDGSKETVISLLDPSEPDDNTKEISKLDKSKINSDIDLNEQSKITSPLTATKLVKEHRNEVFCSESDTLLNEPGENFDNELLNQNKSEITVKQLSTAKNNKSNEKIKLNTTEQDLQTSVTSLNNNATEISESDEMQHLEHKITDELDIAKHTEVDLTSEDKEDNVTDNILDINDPDLDLNTVILELCKEDSSSLSDKIKSLPGISYILIFTKTKTLENFLTFDCILCNPSAGRIMSGRILQKHLRSKAHLLNILKLHNYLFYEEYKYCDEATLAQLPNGVYDCANNLENAAIIATAKTYKKQREDISSVVLQLLEKFSRTEEVSELNPEMEISKEVEENPPEVMEAVDSEDLSEDLNTKGFDKVVIMTNAEYSMYMEKFVNSKVSAFCVAAGNLNNVATAVKCRKKFEPGRTLWLTHPEVFGIDRIEQSDMCTACEESLKIHVLPSTDMTYSNYTNEIQSSFDELIKKVNSFLNAESAFAILPPFPPSFLPLKDTEHDLYHKTVKDRNIYYFTTPSALIGFESLYAELSKQMIPFSFNELSKQNISNRSIAKYLKAVESWNSYLNVETQVNEILLDESSKSKYDQWFECIDIFLTNSLKPSDENAGVKSTSEEKHNDSESLKETLKDSESLKETLKDSESVTLKDSESLRETLKDSRPSSSNRDQGDILNEILGDVATIDEDSDSDIVILDYSPAASEIEELDDSESYDHIVFVCFCKAHAQLVPGKEFSSNISVVMVNSSLNWDEEKKKFETFTQDCKSILFIVVGSPNLLGNETSEPFCEDEMCSDPLLCLDLGLDSNVEILKQVMKKYKLFIINLKKLFEKLSACFLLTPMLPIRCSAQPLITNELSHDRFHSLLADKNTYFTIGGSGKWSTLVNIFQKSYYIRMLKEGHDMYEKEIVDNILKEIKYPSNPIIWLKLSEFSIQATSEYDENEFKILLKKFVNKSRTVIKRQWKDPVCYVPEDVDKISKNSFSLSNILPFLKQNAQKYSNVDVHTDTSASQENEKRMEESENVEKEESENENWDVEANLESKTSIKSQKNSFSLSGILPLLKQNAQKYSTADVNVHSIASQQNKEKSNTMKEIEIIENSWDVSSDLESTETSHVEVISEVDKSLTSNNEKNLYTSTKVGLSQSISKIGQEKNLCHLKILTPPRVASIIIGAKGLTIMQLKNDTKCHIELSKAGVHYPGTNNQTCLLSGSFDSVITALFLILDIVKDQLGQTISPSIVQKTLQLRFVVPSRLAGKIIGKGGQAINKIKSESKAHLQICPESTSNTSLEKSFMVSSTDVERMKAAFFMILEIISHDFQKGAGDDLQKGSGNFSQKGFSNDSQKGFQSITTFPDVSKPPPLMTPLPKQDATGYGRGSNYWNSQTYDNKATGSSYGYGNFSYPPPVSSQTYNTSSITQVANEFSSLQSYGVSEYPTITQVMSGLPAPDSKTTTSFYSSFGPGPSGYNPSSSEDNRTQSSRRDLSPYKNISKRSRSRHSRSISPKRRFSPYSQRKRSRSRSDSVECLVEYPYKRSRNRSRSRSRKYRSKWDRSNSRSRSRSLRKSRSRSRDRKFVSRFGKSSPSRAVKLNQGPLRVDKKPSQADKDKVGDKFSLNGALNLLDRVRNKCGALGGSIKAFITSAKSELEIDRSKALKLIKDDHNILLLRMTANHLKSCIISAPVEEIGMLSKAVEWTANLIEHVEADEKPKAEINLKAIAAASLSKTPDFTISLIKSAFLYEGKLNPTSEEISEAFVKISSMQCEMVLDN